MKCNRRAMLLVGCVVTVLAGLLPAAPAQAAGDIGEGAKAARACMMCHSFAPGRHLTGPSLAQMWGRKAGTAEGFGRYSDALRKSGIVWNEKSLDAWLKNPAALVPGNAMAFPGIPLERTRADLLAYLQAVSEGRVTAPGGGLPNLKRAEPADQVTGIRYCGDAYRVTTGDGKSNTLWEFNLRFKTDGSPAGPPPGKPVIVGSGMRGDRASIVFSRPEEISSFVRRECP